MRGSIGLTLGAIIAAGTIAATASLAATSTVTFDNQSGQAARVKLVGPTLGEVDVPVAEKRTLTASPGQYHIKTRYGAAGDYRYSKGDDFLITETATTRSRITITLHAVIDGNYTTLPIDADAFDGGAGRAPVSPPPAVARETEGGRSRLTRLPDPFPTARLWWVYDIHLTKLPLPKTDVYSVALSIGFVHKSLTENLTADKWETESGTNCVDTSILMLGWEPHDIGAPSARIKLMSGCTSRDLNDLLQCRLRLKGEDQWVKLADLVSVDADGKTYRFIQCADCLSIYPTGAKRCSLCKGSSFRARGDFHVKRF